MEKRLKPATLCVRAGYQPKNGEPVEPPIVQSTTFKYDDSEEMGMLFDLKKEGYFYTRLQNPTNDAVANKIAALEGGVAAVLTSSGQAANFYAVFNICEAGDHIVASNLGGRRGRCAYLKRTSGQFLRGLQHLRGRRPHRGIQRDIRGHLQSVWRHAQEAWHRLHFRQSREHRG